MSPLGRNASAQGYTKPLIAETRSVAAAVLRIWPSGTLPAMPPPGCCAAGIAEAIAATASTTSERGSGMVGVS